MKATRRRAAWDQAPAVDADELSDGQRTAAYETFRALRSARTSDEAATQALARFRDPRGAEAAAQARHAVTAPKIPCPCGCGGKRTARTTPRDHDETPGAAPAPGPDAGAPGKAESSVAALGAEAAPDLRKQGPTDAAQVPSETPDLGKRYEQRNNRLQRRMRLLDDVRPITTLVSLRRCGVMPLSGAVAITQKTDGSGGFAGVFRCGSVWSCPECAPVVRADRAHLMENYALAWTAEHDAGVCTGDDDQLGQTHAPHGMAMATLTSRHGRHAVLEDRIKRDRQGQVILGPDGQPEMRPGQLQRTASAWRRMLQSRWWRAAREAYGIAGATRAIEVTHSHASGWHTHIHAVLWTEIPVTDEVAAELEEELYRRWEAECRHAGLGRPTRKHGVKVEAARRGADGAADLARYLVKVQDKDDQEAGDGPASGGGSRAARPTADQAQRLRDARARRDRARAAGDVRTEADADSLIADIREEIGQADRARALGNELLRGDMKTGRSAGRTPMEILRRALAGDEAEADLWREYERATKGSRMLTWTGQARARLIRLTEQEERDAQDVVQEEAAAETSAVLVQVTPGPWWTRVAAVPGRRGQLRVAVTVATARATEQDLDAEVEARAEVRAVLESWGLVWGRDMYGPGGELCPETGELVAAGERVTPQSRPARRRPRWEGPDALEADAAALGARPRDVVRPEQAARRKKGLPIAREATRTRATTKVSDTPCCVRCGDRVAPGLPLRHIGC
ncbi:hypothetical protein [Streptomyces daliensis]